MKTDHIEIRQISAEETIPIRAEILRAGLPLDQSRFDGDDRPETKHFGAFVGTKHVGVATLLRAPLPDDPQLPETWQLRGMATLPEVRGSGCGRALLQACIEAARQSGGALLWCNARSPAVPFYRQYGLEPYGEEFVIPTAGPHFRMWIRL